MTAYPIIDLSELSQEKRLVEYDLLSARAEAILGRTSCGVVVVAYVRFGRDLHWSAQYPRQEFGLFA